MLDFFDITLLDVILTPGWESLCEKPVHCSVVFIQEFYSNIHGIDIVVSQFVTTFRGTRIIVTPDLISNVLCVPRVVHPDYVCCDHLWIVSRDELISHFYGIPSVWGGKLNTPCSGFANGLKFLKIGRASCRERVSPYV